MPEISRRLLLWRNTIQLFYDHKRPEFTAPFKKAGFSKFTVDSKFLTWQEREEKTPDIVSSSKEGGLVIELTLNNSSKAEVVENYKKIDALSFGIYNLQPHRVDPDVICSRLEYFKEDISHCQIIVQDTFLAYGLGYIKNQNLKQALAEAANGQLKLKNLPGLPFTLVPEMAGKRGEIKAGIAPGIMQIFSPICSGKTSGDLVDEGLERLKSMISPKARETLISVVKQQMDILLLIIPQYLVEIDGVYKRSEKFSYHPNTLGAIGKRIEEWVKYDQVSLAKFSEGTA